MQTEIEAKFLNINHDEIRAKLKKLDGELIHPMRLMRRKNLDYPDNKLELKQKGWVRVRDEGDKVTMSYKQLDDRSLHGTKELDIVVSNFDDACRILETIGLEAKTFQETKRESWSLGSVEIELDEWPWIPPFIELEGPDEKSIKDVAEQLGLDWQDAVHGSVEPAYQAVYDLTEEEINHWPKYTFGPVPEFWEKRRR